MKFFYKKTSVVKLKAKEWKFDKYGNYNSYFKISKNNLILKFY